MIMGLGVLSCNLQNFVVFHRKERKMRAPLIDVVPAKI